MKKAMYLLLLILLTAGMSHAQSVSQVVVANSGATINGASNTLSFTVGEPVIGAIANGPSLGQGFWLGAIEEIVLANEDFTFNVEAAVYPNPVIDYLQLYLKDMAGEDFRVAAYDNTGKRVLYRELLDASENETLNFSSFSSGMYLLTIEQGSTQKSKTFKIIKQ